MRRGVRRGCIRLQGAVLGIDDEDDANFTITVDAKVFHLQAKDAEEREIWVMWNIFFREFVCKIKLYKGYIL